MVEIVSVPLSLDDLAAAELQEMLAYWQGLARDRVAPSWHEVEPLEMPAKLLPYLTVVEVHQSPLDFVYVFYGTGHLALKARDLTGHSINDTLPWQVNALSFSFPSLKVPVFLFIHLPKDSMRAG